MREKTDTTGETGSARGMRPVVVCGYGIICVMGEWKWTKIESLAADILCFALAVSFLALSCDAMTIRSKADMRLWETVADRSLPLSWSWADGADSATLVFSNRVTRAVSSATVQRVANETHGSLAQPAPASGESVVDVRLSQKAGGLEVASDSASLAYVDGAGGGPITVRAAGVRSWNRVFTPRVFAVDPSWQGLVGDSGYDVAWPNAKGVGIIFR